MDFVNGVRADRIINWLSVKVTDGVATDSPHYPLVSFANMVRIVGNNMRSGMLQE